MSTSSALPTEDSNRARGFLAAAWAAVGALVLGRTTAPPRGRRRRRRPRHHKHERQHHDDLLHRREPQRLGFGVSERQQ